MNFSHFVRQAVPAVLTVMLASAAVAAPTTWSFAQSYGANGNISGTFTGQDLNNDQLITYVDGAGNELLGFTLSFSGPTFTGSFGPGQLTIGGIDSSIVEFQYVVGASSLDATLPGPPLKASIVTVVTPISASTNPADSFLLWTAGSATFDPQGQSKGAATIFDTNADTLGDYLSSQAVQVQQGQVSVVPEPSTYLLVVSGLALVGVSARRRAQRSNA